MRLYKSKEVNRKVNSMSYISHYGIKGMRWGYRRYQYADGTRTPAGRKRYGPNGVKNRAGNAVSEAVGNVKTRLSGKQYTNGMLAKGSELSRIQTSDNMEDFAFYATYKQHDQDKYLGLFGNNMKRRANRIALNAENKAAKTGSEEDAEEAKRLRQAADEMKVYQLKIKATANLRIPSDDNAADITGNLLKEKEFRDNVAASIQDSKERMRRPQQQMLFDRAEMALKKEPDKMSSSDKVAVYKALNLTLTNHNPAEIAAQDRFYSELKKKGYDALLDYNDKEFSSYHADRPVIVFNTSAVKLNSVMEADATLMDSLNKKYNRERAIKEAGAQTIGLVTQYAATQASKCASYIQQAVDDYTERNKR